jgi:tetratricopeptide (TPR) repeat protein
MSGRYGMTFARELIERGDYEEAVEAAAKAIAEGADGPEPHFDRGRALELLERYEEALDDFEKAIAINRAKKEMNPFEIDDAYFSAVVAGARAVKPAEGVKLLARYRAFATDGAHQTESLEWEKRLRGELPSLLDKTKAVDAV